MKENIECLMAKPSMNINCRETFVPFDGEGQPSVRLIVSRMLFPRETEVILGERAKGTFDAIDNYLVDPTTQQDECIAVVRDLVRFY